MNCKILKLNETKTVGQAKYTVAYATPDSTADSTAQIVLDIWNNLIRQIKVNKLYKITNLLSMRFWNGTRKLTRTTNTVLSEITDAALKNLQLEENDIPTTDTILHVQSIDSIESVDKYKICAHSLKWLIQAQGKS